MNKLIIKCMYLLLNASNEYFDKEMFFRVNFKHLYELLVRFAQNELYAMSDQLHLVYEIYLIFQNG